MIYIFTMNGELYLCFVSTGKLLVGTFIVEGFQL